MITAYLCDDNEILLQKHQEDLISIAEQNNVLLNTKLFTSGEQLLFNLEDVPNEADIIFLDIQMDGLDGLETAKRLRDFGCQSEIIFLTSCEEYVFDSFDVDPLYYVIKGTTSREKFTKIFLRAVELANKKENDFFTCENAGVSKRIPLHEISYLKVSNRTVTVHYLDGTTPMEFDFYAKMDQLQEELSSKGFIRCHRSYMVSLKHLDEINKNTLITIEGYEIPLGMTYAKDVKLAFSASLADF